MEVSQYLFPGKLKTHPSQNRACTTNAHGSSYYLKQ